MAFVRISIMIPVQGQEARVAEILDDLVKFYHGRQGFITAYRLSADPHAAVKRMGRISVWESEEDAHRTASEQHDLALQSQLKLMVQDQTHEEYSFIGNQPSV
jgi:heme-degrading monooxygenase HmoA